MTRSPASPRAWPRSAEASRARTWRPFARTWPGAAPLAGDRPAGERYNIRFQPVARRAISERLPESVAAAVLEFCEAALAVNPQRIGKPLFGPLVGCHGARRGTYRIVYRIDEASRIVHVLDVDHRSDIYHKRGVAGSNPAAPTQKSGSAHGLPSIQMRSQHRLTVI